MNEVLNVSSPSSSTASTTVADPSYRAEPSMLMRVPTGRTRFTTRMDELRHGLGNMF